MTPAPPHAPRGALCSGTVGDLSFGPVENILFFVTSNLINTNNENNRKINLSFIKKEEDENDVKQQPTQQTINLFDSNNYDTNFPPLGKMK